MARPNKRHIDYWQKRMDEILLHVDRTDIDIFQKVAEAYARNAKDVQAEIFRFYGRFADGEGISLSEAKKKLMGEDLSDYRENAERYFRSAEKDPELLKRLNEQYRSGKVTRLEALQLDLEYQAGILNGTLQGTFSQYLAVTAQYAYQKVMGGRSGSVLNKPALEQMLQMPWNGYNYSEQIWGNTDNLVRDLRKTLEKGFIRGQGPRQMANEIRQKYQVAQHRAETLVRTDGTFIINNATAKRYQDAGLKNYRIHVHIDERTTEICKTIAKEDKLYSFSEFEPGKTAPPFHPNCRSTIVPDLDELMETDL